MSQSDSRDNKLAAALRENLKKRKEQARARETAPNEPKPAKPEPPDER